MKIKLWLITLIVVLFSTPVLSQPNDNPLLEPSSLEAFLDGIVKTGMEDKHLLGVTVSVVQNGGLVLAKGYGLAQTDPPRPVVADQTLFRIASISKTFTFTGAMQLVEQGRLDLNADIEPMMGDVTIEDSYGPLTMIDLMTHSAGFEDGVIGFFYADSLENDLAPAEYLNRFAPHRVRPPGEQLVYSNYGVALAGKVIEAVSGENFADYMDANIFKPLGMAHSSFRDYPNQAADGYLDPELKENRATGYRWAGGSFIPYDHFFKHRASYPAGSVSTTATDMAIFMLAHLNGGAIDGRRILKEKTVEQMHTRLRANADGIPGNAHGFWSGQIRGYKTIEHSGSLLGFRSNMVLLPGLDLGIFVSTNSDAGRGFTFSLARRIVEHAYPPLVSQPLPDPAFSDQHDVYAGRYRSNRRGYKTIDKLNELGKEITTRVNSGGYLIISSSGSSSRWLPLGNHVFEDVDDGTHLAFEVGQSGAATRLYSSYGANVFDRVSYLNSSQLFYIASASTLLLAIGSLFGFWLRRKQLAVQTGGEKLAAFAVGATSLTWLVFFYTFKVLWDGAFAVEPEILAHYPTPSAWVVHILAIVAAVLVVASAFGLWPVWRHRNWPVWRRLRHTVVVLTGLGLVWVLNDWNILGFRYLGA